jgi:hypothetical protein
MAVYSTAPTDEEVPTMPAREVEALDVAFVKFRVTLTVGTDELLEAE